jgi:hypothetical protein
MPASNPDTAAEGDGGIPSPDITLRKHDVRPRSDDGVPSLGFFTPHARRRFQMIEDVTDKRTALTAYAAVTEGPVANLESALEKAIHNGTRLRADYERVGENDDPEENGDWTVHWRYYCESCGFTGAVNDSFTLAEWGGHQHEQFCEEGGAPTVFAYYSDEWDHENVAELAAAGEPDFR